MHSLVSLPMIVLFNAYYVLAQSICSDYVDCFNCSDSRDPLCEWNGRKCEAAKNNTKPDYSPFYTQFDKCVDTESMILQQKYCGSGTLQKGDGEDEEGASLPEVDGKYGTQAILCKYVYMNDDEKKNTLVNVKLRRGTQNYIYMYLEVRFFDGSMDDRTVDRFDYLVSVEKGREIALYYFTKKAFEENPFMIYIKSDKPGISITLIITIVLVIAACIICSVSIFIFSKRLARRNALQRRAGERVAGQQGGAPAQESEDDIKKRKALQLEQLLKDTMGKKTFDDDLGKHNLNCTICLEEFSNKSTVCLTACNHVFHYDCLKVWLTKNLINSKCPNCNFHLLPELNETAVMPNNVEVQNVFVSSARQNNPQSAPINVPYSSVSGVNNNQQLPVPSVPYNSINGANLPQAGVSNNNNPSPN